MIQERWLEIQDKPLLKGAHDPDGQMCVMEMAAYVANEPWSDHPQCVSPAIAAFMRSWNDSLDDDKRQMLKPYVVKVIGTNTGPEDEERRAWLATDWLVRTFTPAWLDLAKLPDHAQKLRDLPALESTGLANAAIGTIREAQQAAYAAGDAAWAAAGDAAGDAAWAAAWAAAGDAAWAAAGDAAWAAAGAAAWAAAGDAAWAAAGDALAPTVIALQESALRLLDDMIAVGAAVGAEF